MQSAFDLPLRAAPRYAVPFCFLGHRSKCSQCCCCSWFALRWVCLCSYTRGDLSLVKCLCCACGDVCSGPKQEIRYLEVENFWFGFRIRLRAELRIRFSLLKEFGNALCLCEVLTSLENQSVSVCVLTHCCYLYRTFLELQGEVFLVSWWLKVLFYQHTVDRREKKKFWIYFQLLTDADRVLFPLKSNIFTVWMTVCFPRILQFPPTV